MHGRNTPLPPVVLHLEHGCASREEREDGTVRYRVNGRHFKGVVDEEGDIIPEGEMRSEPWTVTELVHRAIEVVEELGQGPLLSPATSPPPRGGRPSHPLHQSDGGERNVALPGLP